MARPFLLRTGSPVRAAASAASACGGSCILPSYMYPLSRLWISKPKIRRVWYGCF